MAKTRNDPKGRKKTKSTPEERMRRGLKLLHPPERGWALRKK